MTYEEMKQFNSEGMGPLVNKFIYGAPHAPNKKKEKDK